MTSRELARRSLLALAQAEIIGNATPNLRAAAAEAFRATGLAVGFDVIYLQRGFASPLQIMQMALRCAIVKRCKHCRQAVNGYEWHRAEVVGWARTRSRMVESRQCPTCGETIAVVVTNESAA